MTITMTIANLSKSFGGISAVEDLNFNIKTGDVMGIIGPNGAGKTTVFNLITGVYQPTRGTVHFKGEDITGKAPDEIVKMGISRTFQNIRLFRNLTALENVVTALDLHNPLYNLAETFFLNIPFVDNKVKRAERQLREKAAYYLELAGIADQADKLASSLPYGLQRKLEIARALALEPELLLLDEPAAGMNPEESIALAKLIKEIQVRLKLTVFLIEHHMDLVMELCDHLYVINFGRELAEGSPEEIQANPAVLKAYLGEGYKRA
ncbi:MAG: ABC transporter ATP-binding protein [Peptococcaceae bacterium]|jgi:branched-chain amino acid transport system ATP-binding protein|nr:ABC transporter ATP-binding protein [Peptococcaceae bacterium]